MHFPPLLLYTLIAIAILLRWFWPAKFSIPYPLNLSGIVFIVMGIVLSVWARMTIEKHNSTLDPNQSPATLITEQPFRISRNPFYLGYLFILLGVVALLGPVYLLIAPFTFFVVINWFVIPTEENNLKKKFGKFYQGYYERTGRWVKLF